jgi:hypothetical protein
MANTFRRDMHDKWQTKMAAVKANIFGILKHRKNDAFISCWDKFFNEIPSSPEVPHHTYKNYLQNLARHHGGVVQVPLRVTSSRPVTASYYFDLITWRDGPLSRNERLPKLKEMGICSSSGRKGTAAAGTKKGAATAAGAKKGAATAVAKKRRGRPKQNSLSSDEGSVQSEDGDDDDDEDDYEGSDDDEEEEHEHVDTGATKKQEEGCGMVETGQDGERARGDSKEADDDDDEEEVLKYKVGDDVRTINGLVASVVSVNLQSGTYDIKYRKEGDIDKNVYPKFFKPYVPPTRKRTSETKNWDYREEPVETTESFIARTGLSAEFNVLPPRCKAKKRLVSQLV